MNFYTRDLKEKIKSSYLLAFDTFSTSASFAIGYNEEILASLEFESKISHTQNIIDSVTFLLNKLKIDVKEIKGIIVNRGPGSFTGLRIGLSFAKGLSLANNAFIIGFDTFILYAHSKLTPFKYIATLIDAGRNEIYAQFFLNEVNDLKPFSNIHLISPANLSKLIDKNYKNDTLLIGNGAIKYKNIFEKEGYINIERGEKFLSRIMLKLTYEGKGQEFLVHNLDVLYIRKSDAETKRFK